MLLQRFVCIFLLTFVYSCFKTETRIVKRKVSNNKARHLSKNVHEKKEHGSRMSKKLDDSKLGLFKDAKTQNFKNSNLQVTRVVDTKGRELEHQVGDSKPVESVQRTKNSSQPTNLLFNQLNATGKLEQHLSHEKRENINIVDTRGANSNMITDIKVPAMAQAIQGATENNSISANEADVNSNNFTEQVQPSAKIQGFLNALAGDSTDITEQPIQQNSTLTSTAGNIRSNVSHVKDVKAQKKQIIGPGYYEPECDDEKKCPDGHYCHMYVCVECHRSKHACTERVQCCNGMECVYGRCEDKPKGSPGAFCHKDKDCAGEACCVLEPTVDEHESICKPKLAEYHQCSPILYRKLWIGDNKPDCGPCKDGLLCSQRGNEGNHEVCMKKP